MKRGIFPILILFILIIVGFSGCLNERTVNPLARQMREKYESIRDYKANINYSSYSQYYEGYNKIIKKPDKLKYEYFTPSNKEGDFQIINGNTLWNFDKSKNIAHQHSCNVNIGEESLETPDFLNYLLFLIDNFEVNQLEDETIGNFTTNVLEMTPKFETTFSKMKYWIDKETLFPIKWEIFDTNNEIKIRELVTSFEINTGVEDNEFDLPEGIEIITPNDWVEPATIEEIEDIVGFSILFPTYLPQGYSLEEEFSIGSDSSSVKLNDGTYEIGYFQNNIRKQGSYVRITFPSNDSYAEFIDYTTGEILKTVYNSTGSFPSEWQENMVVETYTFDIILAEALEDIFGGDYLPKYDPEKVDINGIIGEYWVDKDTGQYGQVVYQRACLSWGLNEYWLMLTAGGDAFLDSNEMTKIAESINI